MNAEILARPPISGTIDEAHFDAVGRCTWVRFDAQEPWCGVFGGGTSNHEAVAFTEGGLAFVVARGQGYMIDVAARALLHKTANDWLADVVVASSTDQFVAADRVELHAYSRAGLDWSSGRVALDEIRLLGSNGPGISGQVSGPDGWVDFSLTVPEFEFRCEWECPLE